MFEAIKRWNNEGHQGIIDAVESIPDADLKRQFVQTWIIRDRLACQLTLEIERRKVVEKRVLELEEVVKTLASLFPQRPAVAQEAPE